MSASELAWESRLRLDRHFTNDLHMPAPGGWIDTGSMTGGWGKGSGFFRYKYLTQGVTAIAAKALTLGTVADGTTILTNANGLPAGVAPGSAQQLLASTNSLKGSPVTSGGFEPAWLEFEPAGSVQCFGCVLAATFLNCFGLIFTDT